MNLVDVLWAEEAVVPVSDRGLAYGDGLFETIRICHNKPTLADRHSSRLLEGAQRLGIHLTRAFLAEHLLTACERYAREPDWVLKVTLTRGSGGRGYLPPETARPRLIFSANPLPPAPDPEGVSICLSNLCLSVSPALAGLKSLSRLDQVLASRTIAAGCYEAILADRAGRLLEGTRTNIMLLMGDQWLTPPSSDLAVAGVMRARVIDYLRQKSEWVRERALSPAMLTSRDCRGMILMNSVAGVVPVRNFGCVWLPVDARLATICGQRLLTE
ncbi:MAG: aminotransferase class IV [Oleiphilaceae bacterium]|nr:aminotransferase class IV [Oleiphilaceae bacterium]